jgi:hypothetical protein
VACDVNRDNLNDLRELHMRSLEITKSYVNLIAFKLGRGLSVTLDRVIPPAGGEPQLINVHNPALAATVTVFDSISNFDGVDRIVVENPTLMRVLDDMIVGFTTTHYAAVNCAKVADGLKHLIAAPSSDEKTKWLQTQQTLNVDKAYLTLLTDASKDARHGKVSPASEAKIKEMIQRTWTLMNRYLAYQRNGRQKLSIDTYPLLKG